MKVLFTLLAVFLAFVFNAHGQKNKLKKADVQVGDLIKTKKPQGDFIGYSDKYYYELCGNVRIFAGKSKLYLRKFDKKLGLVSETQVIFPGEGSKKFTQEGVAVMNNKFYFLTSHFEKSTRTHTYYYSVLGANDQLSAPKEMIKTTYDEKVKDPESSFGFALSEERNFMLVRQVLPSKKSENAELMAYVFDSDMKQVWKKNIELKYTTKNTELVDYEVSDLGSAFIRLEIIRADKEVGDVAKKRQKDKEEGVKKNKRTENTAHIVYAIDMEGKEAKEYLLDLGKGAFPTDMTSDFMPDGKIVVGGLYSARNNITGITGPFYVEIDPINESMATPKVQPFSKAESTKILGATEKELQDDEKEKKKKKKEKDEIYANYDIRYFKPDGEGGYYLVAENFYITYHTRTDSRGNTYTYTIYHYDDVIAMKLNSEGKVEWLNIIKKRQIQGQISGISVRGVDGNIFITYNDNSQNSDETAKGGKKSKNRKLLTKDQAVAKLVSITSDGVMTEALLLTAKDKLGTIYPREVLAVENENALIFKAFYRKTFRLVKVRII